ncbi:MAG: hypothetical protein K6E50_10060 [Lachnospiraceae bacterium]|nr:hypothetical protein [Lachnospiraceae bacterium]
MNLKRFKRAWKKSWYRKRVFQLAVFWSMAALFLSVALMLLFGKTADAKSETEEAYYKYYHSFTIESGDSLWAYAKEYACPDGRQSINEYIAEVRRINHLTDDSLVAGKSIVLPYYSTEYVCSSQYR